MPRYFFNERTGKLHIEGYCGQSTVKPYDIKYFDTEQEATTFAGRFLIPCKVCEKHKNKIIQEAGER